MTVATLRAHRNGTERETPTRVRVAIYTRVSTDERLDQEFNSLDAQRQAVEAYVQSQRSEGWVALPDLYDDGGFTGANTDRPAFRRLLDDVTARRIDAVGVYKIDRLSRSLLDFTQLMRLFDEAGVMFFSVTQQFSTSTSVGRMTLNLLATFAQFEREQVSERTRDKIHATRRRGCWTGGRPVLGYDVVAGKLVVNPDEAERVRAIFALFLELGSVIATVEELRRRGWTTKTWTNQSGRLVQGSAFNKSSLRGLLTNPLYVGKVTLGEEQHVGVHEAIVDQATWDATQRKLRSREAGGAIPSRNKWNLLLKGLLYCGACGAAMSHHYASKKGRKVSYYVCQTAQKQGAAACPRSRLSVREIEGHVVERIKAISQDEALVKQVVEAAHRELETRGPKLEAELHRLDLDRRAFTAERKNLTAAVGNGGEKVPALVERLRQVEESMAALTQQSADARLQLDALADQTLDEADLRAALARFDPIWDELFPAEKARLLSLLIERVTYDSRSSEVTITFHANGVRSLAARNKGDER